MSKSSQTGELSYDSLNLTGFISRYITNDCRTCSTHPGQEKGLHIAGPGHSDYDI